MTKVLGISVRMECPRCQGSGRVDGSGCTKCYGSGACYETISLSDLAELLEPEMTKLMLDKRLDKLDTAPNLS